jgi:hypothetical protein
MTLVQLAWVGIALAAVLNVFAILGLIHAVRRADPKPTIDFSAPSPMNTPAYDRLVIEQDWRARHSMFRGAHAAISIVSEVDPPSVPLAASERTSSKGSPS